jgi:hypothetical protein
MAKRSKRRPAVDPVAPATAAAETSPLVPLEQFQDALFEEHAISRELIASGEHMQTRLRVIGDQQWTIYLPYTEYRRGRVLLALKPFAALAMMKAVVVCIADASRIESWLICGGGLMGLVWSVSWTPFFTVVDTQTRHTFDGAPKLVGALAHLIVAPPAPSLSQRDMDLVAQILGPEGDCPAQVISPAHAGHWKADPALVN